MTRQKCLTFNSYHFGPSRPLTIKEQINGMKELSGSLRPDEMAYTRKEQQSRVGQKCSPLAATVRWGHVVGLAVNRECRGLDVRRQ